MLSANLMLSGENGEEGGGEQGGGPVVDPYLQNVSLYLKGEGANLGTVIEDSSVNNLDVELHGNVITSTAQFVNGSSALFFDGLYLSGNRPHLRIPKSVLFDYADGDFTIESLVYFSDLLSINFIFGTNTHLPPYHNLRFFYNGNGFISAQISTNNGLSYNVAMSADISSLIFAQEWHHVALVRSGTDLFIYIDYMLKGATTITGSISYDQFDVQIGNDYGSSNISSDRYHFRGYMDSFRFTLGVARQPSEFIQITV